MADPRLVSEWLEKAEEDFGFAISIIEDSTFYAQICFHFHQAAEKHLKTYMIARDMEFKRIHDLPMLLKSCSAIEPNLQVLQDDCRFLNRFSILDILYTGQLIIARKKPLRPRKPQNISVMQ
jgi:HEPN domain-containing protein